MNDKIVTGYNTVVILPSTNDSTRCTETDLLLARLKRTVSSNEDIEPDGSKRGILQCPGRQTVHLGYA